MMIATVIDIVVFTNLLITNGRRFCIVCRALICNLVSETNLMNTHIHLFRQETHIYAHTIE